MKMMVLTLTHASGGEDVAHSGTFPHGGACRWELGCGRWRINGELWDQGQKENLNIKSFQQWNEVVQYFNTTSIFDDEFCNKCKKITYSASFYMTYYN